MVIQTAAEHGLNAGDMVVIWGVCGTTSSNGIRQVGTVSDATHFSITDLSGVAIAGNGDWCSGAAPGYPAAPQGGGKVNGFSLTDQPRGFLDGSDGTITRKLALGTQNGLVSLVVSGNEATVTTSYSHGVRPGDQIAVWNTSNVYLNNAGSPYTVKTVTDSTFTFDTSNVASGDYTQNNACGADGNSNCVRISQLAYTGNPWWDEILSRITKAYSGTATSSSRTAAYRRPHYSFPAYWAAAAVQFFVDQANTQMLTVAKYGINNFEKVNGVNWTGNGASPGGRKQQLQRFRFLHAEEYRAGVRDRPGLFELNGETDFSR